MLVVDKKYNHILVDMSPNGFGINYNITNYVKPTKYGIFVGLNPYGPFLSGIDGCRPLPEGAVWESNCYIIRDQETVALASSNAGGKGVQPYCRVKVIPHDNELPNFYHSNGALGVLTFMAAKKKFDKNESGDYVFYNRIYEETEIASGRNLLNYLTDCNMFNGKELWTEFDLKELRAQCNDGKPLEGMDELSAHVMRLTNTFSKAQSRAMYDSIQSPYITFFDQE